MNRPPESSTCRTRSPSMPTGPSVAHSSFSPAIDFTGYRQSSATFMDYVPLDTFAGEWIVALRTPASGQLITPRVLPQLVGCELDQDVKMAATITERTIPPQMPELAF